MSTTQQSSTLPKEDTKTVITGVSEEAKKSLADLLSGSADSLVSQRIAEGNEKVVGEIKESVSSNVDALSETLKSVLEKNDNADGGAVNEMIDAFSSALADSGIADTLKSIQSSIESNKAPDVPDTSMTIKTPEEKFIEMHEQLAKQNSFTKAALDTEALNQFISEQSELGELQSRVYHEYLDNEDKEEDDEKTVDNDKPQKIANPDAGKQETETAKTEDEHKFQENIINLAKNEIVDSISPLKQSLDEIVANTSVERKETPVVEEKDDDSDEKQDENKVTETITQLSEVVKEVQIQKEESVTKEQVKEVPAVSEDKESKEEAPTQPKQQVVEHEVKIIDDNNGKDDETDNKEEPLKEVTIAESSLTAFMSPVNEILGTVKEIQALKEVPKVDDKDSDDHEQEIVREDRIVERTVTEVAEVVRNDMAEKSVDEPERPKQELTIVMPEQKQPAQQPEELDKSISDDINSVKKDVEQIVVDAKDEHKEVEDLEANSLAERDNNKRIEIEESERNLQQPDNTQMYEHSTMSQADMIFLAQEIGKAVIQSYLESSEIKRRDAQEMDAFMDKVRS